MKRALLHILVLVITITVLAFQPNKGDHLMIKKDLFGKLSDGREVYSYTLTNSSGSQVKIINYGAVVVSLLVPDKNGKFADIVTGYENPQGYETGTSYFGAIVGRYGNRIGKGQFKLNGKSYQLTINDGPNHLHGGTIGFNKVLWDAEENKSKSGPSLKLTYTSKDGEQGYPGTLNISVIYTLTDKNELRIDYKATTDKPTILNPTHHSYFNLSGDFKNTILDHELTIDADSITPIDSTLITTGKMLSVKNTPFDFKKPTKIGLHINDNDEQIKFGKGFDHNWVLNNYRAGKVRKVVTLYEPVSGRLMEVLTDQPGMQFYSGNFMNGTSKGKDGATYPYRTGLCLEAQHYPDSPNKPKFPTVTLRPGATYKQTTIYRFSTK